MLPFFFRVFLYEYIAKILETNITGVPFENGIALTRKNVGEGDWDWHAESWIP